MTPAQVGSRPLLELLCEGVCRICGTKIGPAACRGFSFVLKTVGDRRPSALPFIAADIAGRGLSKRLPRQLVIAPEYLFYAAAIAVETPVGAKLDFARFLEFDVVEYHPVGDAAVSTGVERRDAALGPDRIADFHHLPFEQARDVDVCRGVVAFDEGYAGRVALNAVARAAAQAVALVARARRDAPEVALLFHRPFVATRRHVSAVHDCAVVDALGVQKAQFGLGELRHFSPSPEDNLAIAGFGTNGFIRKALANGSSTPSRSFQITSPTINAPTRARLLSHAMPRKAALDREVRPSVLLVLVRCRWLACSCGCAQRARPSRRS